MATPRTRKTTADDTEDKATTAPDARDKPTEDKAVPEAPETKSPALDGPATPEVAPLEPPAETQPPAKQKIRNPQQLLPEKIGDAIVDDSTGLPPDDIDTVFEPVPPNGFTLRCTLRLVENVGMGIYNTPTTRLLLPAGAELAPADAQRIIQRLRGQADKK
ncbi:hypothetical protein [Streptomyces sp. NPDC088915]|uniref:hypothetical protein n=1 Tax=Streptomyces sp. NPDC088915 TaxID=3365912 RepID=UPI0037FA7A30